MGWGSKVTYVCFDAFIGASPSLFVFFLIIHAVLYVRGGMKVDRSRAPCRVPWASGQVTS